MQWKPTHTRRDAPARTLRIHIRMYFYTHINARKTATGPKVRDRKSVAASTLPSDTMPALTFLDSLPKKNLNSEVRMQPRAFHCSLPVFMS